jgi:hypothetical protein
MLEDNHHDLRAHAFAWSYSFSFSASSDSELETSFGLLGWTVETFAGADVLHGMGGSFESGPSRRSVCISALSVSPRPSPLTPHLIDWLPPRSIVGTRVTRPSSVSNGEREIFPAIAEDDGELDSCIGAFALGPFHRRWHVTQFCVDLPW